MALFLANAYARGSLRARPKRCSDKAQFTESNNPDPLRMYITIRLIRLKAAHVPPVIFGSSSVVRIHFNSHPASQKNLRWNLDHVKNTVILELKTV